MHFPHQTIHQTVLTGNQLGAGLDSVVRPARGASLHGPHTGQRGGGGEEPAQKRRLRPLADVQRRQARGHQGRGLHGRRLENMPVGHNQPGPGCYLLFGVL